MIDAALLDSLPTTRRALLDTLKRRGEARVDELAETLGVTISAVRQHLTALDADGWVLHRDPDTYRYIPASIRQYPGAEAVARMFEARGFMSVRAYPVLGGLMTIHHAVRT